MAAIPSFARATLRRRGSIPGAGHVSGEALARIRSILNDPPPQNQQSRLIPSRSITVYLQVRVLPDLPRKPEAYSGFVRNHRARNAPLRLRLPCFSNSQTNVALRTGLGPSQFNRKFGGIIVRNGGTGSHPFSPTNR
jgi:hypothetical protein